MRQINKWQKVEKEDTRGDILRLLRKKNLEGKWLTIYVNVEEH